jgi:CheY-like chemotaxis protein
MTPASGSTSDGAHHADALPNTIFKSASFSSMSQELRTPLHGILGFAQLMESDTPPPTPRQQESIGQILQAGWHLLKLINEILDVAKAESGTLSPEPVSLAEVIGECQALLEGQAQQRGIQITLRRPGAHLFVRADRTRLTQVLIGFLSNAVKHSRALGTVEVQCAESAPGRIRVSIRDTGLGMPPEQLARLFQPFTRVGHEASSIESTGVGLVVAKQLIELMEGVVGVESTVGVGSTFWLELGAATGPKFVPASEEPDRLEPSLLPGSGPVRLLLYVEDDLANLKLVERLIERRPDLSLVSAETGLRGVQLARSRRPDVILMDINLPDINGFEALELLRADPATALIPVIAITANARPHDIDKGRQAGFFEYLTKPIKVNEFTATLNAALELAGLQPGRAPVTGAPA